MHTPRFHYTSHNRATRGFTLIELLVVVAIIGLLASVVLANVNQARDQGRNASIKNQMSQMRSQAEIFYTPSSGYSGLCSDGDIQDLLDSAAESSPGSETCNDATEEYAASMPMADSSQHWCVDSSGFSGEISNQVSGTQC